MQNISKDKESFYSLFTPLTTKKAIIFIIMIGIVVFFNMLFNGFVWDDITYVVFDPYIHSLNLLALMKTNSFNQVGQYRALTAIYFAIIYSLFANSAFFYHVVQLSIHIINSVLVFLLFNKFFKKQLAFFLSLIFLVHPMQVESVSFIAGADNTLFFLFGMLALYLSFDTKYSLRKAILIFTLLELSLLSKETGIGFLLLTIVFAGLFHKNKLISFSLLGTCTLLIYFLIRFGIGGVFFNASTLRWVIPIENLSFSARLLNMPEIVFYYVKTFLYPQNLAIDQLWIIRSVNFSNFYFPLIADLIVFLAIIIFGIYLFKKRSTLGTQYIFFTCWLFGGLIFYSQILPLDATVADRWIYFPMVGFLGILGFAVKEVSNKRMNKNVFLCVASIIIILLSIRTMIRNANWTDNLTLFSHDAKVADNFDIESNIGAFLSDDRLYTAALPHTLKSVQLYPYDVNLSNLGFIYEQLGEYRLAQQYYKESITTPHISSSHQSTAQYSYLRWSGIYLFHGKPQIALIILGTALRMYPRNWTLWDFLALSEYESNDRKAALLAAGKARQLFPNESTNKLYYLISNNQSINFQQL